MSFHMRLDNVASGIKLQSDLVFVLVDNDNQTMTLSSSSQIKLSPVTEGAGLIGTDASKVAEGVAVFDNVGFVYKPGAQKLLFKATNSEIDQDRLSKLGLLIDNMIEVNFRWCQPGETIYSETMCRVCSASTYSLKWNSTK